MSYVSARQLLFELNPNVTTVNPQCLTDTTDFMDAVIGTKFAANFPDMDLHMWAIQSK
jgi:hypothetical protein